MKGFPLIFALAVLGSASLVNAATFAPNQRIVKTGAQQGTGYFFFASSGSCAIWYAALNNPAGNTVDSVARLNAIVLSAYLTGKNITRIDYIQTGSACYASLIEF